MLHRECDGPGDVFVTGMPGSLDRGPPRVAAADGELLSLGSVLPGDGVELHAVQEEVEAE